MMFLFSLFYLCPFPWVYARFSHDLSCTVCIVLVFFFWFLALLSFLLNFPFRLFCLHLLFRLGAGMPVHNINKIRIDLFSR